MSARVALVCGVPVEDVTLDEAAQRVCHLVVQGRNKHRTHQVVTVNTDFLANSLIDPGLRRLLQNADLAIPDGMPVVWVSKLLGAPLRTRVAGADLVPELADRCRWAGYSMYLLGGAEGVAEQAAESLRRRYPGLQVAGESGGQFSRPEDMDPRVLARIARLRPDVLCVGLGHPKQERWIEAYRERVHVPVMIGVGASLDFLAGTQRRAPEWMQRTGTEWLHRTLRQPARFLPRYTRDLVRVGPRLFREAVVTRQRTHPGGGVAAIERRDHLTMVRATGRLRLEPAVLGWSDAMWNEPPTGHQVVVDCKDRTCLDPEELAALVMMAKKLSMCGGALTLASVGEPVMRQLLERRLYAFFRVSSHRPSAEPAIVDDPGGETPVPTSLGTRVSEPKRIVHA
jgi:exopolysaccharide biosynthesis WecB/TagA/CpsF family protein